jgi:hypothetical protein
LLLVATAVLAGCANLPTLTGGRAPEKLSVAQGDIVVAGPPGYCIDKGATRDNEDGAFVLLGSCASIANSVRAAAPQVPAVLTASISAQGDADIDTAMDRLATFFESDQGRAALARNGDAGSVQVLSTARSDGAFIVRASDSSPAGVQGLAQDYWRALFDIRGHIVTLTVIAFEAKPMSETAARAVLEAFVRRMKTENPPPQEVDDSAT